MFNSINLYGFHGDVFAMLSRAASFPAPLLHK